MLKVLRSIVQEVNRAKDLDRALNIIVRRVKSALQVDVCSIYLADHELGELELMASEGLAAGAVHHVHLSMDEGLVGYVAQRAELLNLDEATQHHRYRYFPETGEEQYHAFLGVPIINHRETLGVLVVQQKAAQCYLEDTVTLLVTLAAQLAGAIALAEVVGGIDTNPSQSSVSRPLSGIPSAPGVGIGTVRVVHSYADLNSIPDKPISDVAAERVRFMQAVDAVKRDVKQMLDMMADLLPAEEIALFDAYRMMLEGDSITGAVCDGIAAGNWAPGALREVVNAHIRLFDEMEDSYLRQRIEDVRDLGQRILTQLERQPEDKRDYQPNTILVAEEITATMLAEVPQEQIAGIVAIRGSSTSHAAIVARALGLPAVLGVKKLPLRKMEGLPIIVDGYAGNLYIKPTEHVQKEFQRLQCEEQVLTDELAALRDQPAITPDGVKINLYANTGLQSDVNPSLECGAEGVGLYRTEFPFMVRESFPSEEEQRKIYRQVLESFAPSPVTVRTLDIGGDKMLPYFPIEEDNPYLGWRGIRVTLDHPEIFLVQIRAMLRANCGLNNLRMLLPMVSTTTEIDDALKLIKRAHQALLEEGEATVMPPVGVMIEVPSMLFQVDRLAERVDFISIGSNDLTQYLMAVDRNSEHVSALYDPLNPAVINALKQLVDQAGKEQLPLSLCGEMAGDPAAIIVLLGLGISTFSMSASSLLRAKWVIRNISQQRAVDALKKVLKMEDAQSIRRYLNEMLEQEGLGGLLRVGK
jgi:phosphotransferase system enzyme I (PtsP)